MKKKNDFIHDFIYKNWKHDIRCNEVIDSIKSLSILFRLPENCSKYILENWIKYLLKKDGMDENMVKHALISMPYTNEIHIFVPDDIDERLEWIDHQPFHEQRTQEWHDFRWSCITASFVPKILGNLSEYNSALKEKVQPLEKRGYGIAALHGVKYEEMAQSIYEDMNNVKISEYGCIKHDILKFVGASPDGIVTVVNEGGNINLLGRMLEIKCVYTRLINGVPKKDYWLQVQLQLEVCNLEFCDFFECFIEETTDEDVFKKKCESVIYYGMVIDSTDNDGKTTRKYLISTNYESVDDLISEKDNYLMKIIQVVDIVHVSYWTLQSYSLLTIKRNRDWFKESLSKLNLFWEDVKKCREDISKLPENPKKTNKPKSEKKVLPKKWLGD